MTPTNFSFSVPCARPLLGLLERYSFPLTAPSGVVGVGIFSLCMSLVMASAPLRAMEWTAKFNFSLTGGASVYSGEGEIDADDAQKLEKLYASRKSQERAVSSSALSVVRLNSLGGDIEGGIELGKAIRKLGLSTEVPGSSDCASACTFAFLGGVERRVEGAFGIHALSLDKRAPRSDANLDAIQLWGSRMVKYARDMVGKSDMAEVALTLGGGTEHIRLVPDNLLRDWNIITIAIRPSQLYPANELHTLSCETSSSHSFVLEAVCNGPDLARLDRRITAALAALRTRPFFDRVELEQRRWSSSRDQCEDAFPLIGPDRGPPAFPPGMTGIDVEALRRFSGPNGGISLPRRTGTLGVNDCLVDIYSIRAKELEALVAYFEAGETPTAKKGWKTPSQ